MKDTIKLAIAVVAFLGALVIGFIALFLPPQGIIDSSVLWFTSQLLVFVATLLGLDLTIGRSSTRRNDNDKKEESK